MALVYSELSSAYPSSGGEYVIVWEVLGAPLAYVVIILNLCVMIFIPAVLGLGAGQYFSLVLPEIPPIYAALIVIAISTAFGILNIRLNAWATGAFLVIELACLIYFSYVGTTHIVQPFSNSNRDAFCFIAGWRVDDRHDSPDRHVSCNCHLCFQRVRTSYISRRKHSRPAQHRSASNNDIAHFWAAL